MNAEQRAAIRDNARYLQSVRPIDPEEIYEYVEGQPHPAAVRQVLREEAFDLGFVERDDGTFVPVDDGPVDVAFDGDAFDGAVEGAAFDGVPALPDRHERRLEALLVDRWGSDWARGESGNRLRSIIRQVKAAYLERQGKDVEYDAETALAYAVYHLPGYYAVAAYAVAELATDGLVPRRLRVLDVGAGVGGPALALLDLLPDDCLVEYHAVEPSDAADVFASLVEPGRNRTVTVHRTPIEEFDATDALGDDADSPDGRGDGSSSGRDPDSDASFDLVLFANVLSELDDPVGVVDEQLRSLSEDGTALLLAPADRNTAIQLREVERAVCDSARRGAGEPDGGGDGDGTYAVYAPTVRLWPGHAPTDRGWSFTRKPDLAVPSFQARLDRAAGATGEFVNVDVQYAYSFVRRDGRRRIDVTADPSRHARMADSDQHVTNRVDCLAAKLSHDLGERNPLYRVSDGSESVDHYAVLTDGTALNRALETAGYGSLLAFENALVLWNDDERSYNLVVDEACIVDVVDPVGPTETSSR